MRTLEEIQDEHSKHKIEINVRMYLAQDKRKGKGEWLITT